MTSSWLHTLLASALALSITARADLLVGPGTGFTPTAQPSSQSSSISTVTGSEFLNADGTVRVIPSDNGIPLTLRPGLTAQSPLILDSLQTNITLSAQNGSAGGYVQEYRSYLNSSGVFDNRTATSGSAVSASSGNTSNVTVPLQPPDTYVFLVANSANQSNATLTYKITSLGTTTTPSGQTVTAILSPGNLATLVQYNSTGSAFADLQALQENANGNGYATFFLADQQAAVQIAASDYAARTSRASAFGNNTALPPTVSAASPPVSSAGRRLTQTGRPAYLFNITGNTSTYAGQLPTQSQSSGGADLSTSATPDLPRTILGLNQAVSVPVGDRVSVQLNMQDNIGNAFLIAYYDPASLPGATTSSISYTAPAPSDPQIRVVARYKLSSVVVPNPTSVFPGRAPRPTAQPVPPTSAPPLPGVPPAPGLPPPVPGAPPAPGSPPVPGSPPAVAGAPPTVAESPPVAAASPPVVAESPPPVPGSPPPASPPPTETQTPTPTETPPPPTQTDSPPPVTPPPTPPPQTESPPPTTESPPPVTETPPQPAPVPPTEPTPPVVPPPPDTGEPPCGCEEDDPAAGPTDYDG